MQEKQREYERRIRATKRELAGLDAAAKTNPELAEQLQDQFTRKSVLLKKREAALAEFTKTHNLQRDKSREQAYYGKDTTQGFGRSTSQKAVWANRKALYIGEPGGILSLTTFDLKSVFLQGQNSDEIVNTIDRYPSLLGARNPAETKMMFEDLGYTVNPLGGKSSLKGISFEDGGGYRVSFFGDGYFQYHPAEKSHHEGAYWKIANGKRGKKRYELDGTPKKR